MKRLTLALILLSQPVMANGLVDQVAELRCAVEEMRLARFDALDGYDVSGPLEAWDWEEIATEPAIPEDGEGLKRAPGAGVTVDYEGEYRFIRIRVGGRHTLRISAADANALQTSGSWNARSHVLVIDGARAQVVNPDGVFYSVARLSVGPAGAFVTVSNRPTRAIPRGALTPVSFRSRCTTGDDDVMCLKEFILELPRGARLEGVRDIASLFLVNNANTRVTYDLKLWGLARPGPSEECR